MAPSRAPTEKPFTYCEGSSPAWDPTTYLADKELQARAEALLADHDDLHAAIATSFSLPRRDPYVYHAIVSVTLPEVQHVVSLGGRNGLHAWYRAPAPAPADEDEGDAGRDALVENGDGEGGRERQEKENKNKNKKVKEDQQQQQQPSLPPNTPLPPPPQPDIEAYLAIFSPSTSTPSALKTFGSNAKKGSLRSAVAAHLLSKRFLHPALPAHLHKLPKIKPGALPFPNPYLAYLAWSCRALEWVGPSPSHTEAARGASSHHVLPVLMHHFGCACPSHEALEVLRLLAAGREVIDMGSGNGYWTSALRHYGLPAVTAVDNAQSAWRASWVPDTVVVADGASWLARARRGAPDAVLLLVYPIVGGGVAGGAEGGFTRRMVDAYRGDTLAVVGTQNRNGYTGFRGVSMDEWMEREHGDEWVKVVQVALPSFAGKDEALFVFQRGERAPARVDKAAEAGEGKGGT